MKLKRKNYDTPLAVNNKVPTESCTFLCCCVPHFKILAAM
jgi:hypothetical protein